MPEAVRIDADTVRWAAFEACRLLLPLEDRWAHVRGVVTAAEEIAIAMPHRQRPLLVASAYLHDIGWAPELTETHFHPIDGARWIRRSGYERLARMVANHSGARFEARMRGLAIEMAEFRIERSPAADALTYCDLTTGPTGARVSVEERWANIRERYGVSHVAVVALGRARPTLLRSVARTEARLQRLKWAFDES